jgi:tetratricopeptide (TPR) repeat protein
MPDIQDLEQFKSRFLSFGNEPSILAERGEKVRDVLPPESELSDDLSMLLDEVDQELGFDENPESETQEAAPAVTQEADQEAGETPDLDDFLASFGDDLTGESPGDPASPDDSAPGGFDLPELDDAEEPFDDAEEPFDDAEEPFDDAEEPFDDAEEPSDVEDLEAFDFPDFEEAEEPEAFGLPDLEDAEEPEDEVFEDFDLPDLEDVEEPGEEEVDEFEAFDDTAEPETAQEPEPEPEPEEFVFDETGAPISDNFDMPDFPDTADGYDESSDEASELQELEDDSFETDEFSLGDLGQDFDILDETPQLDDDTPAEEGDSAFSGDLDEAAEGEIALTDDEFKRLKTHLISLPLNLKLLIEEQIGEKELSGPQLRKLLEALKEGKSPKDIANLVGKITGQKIKIPREFEKRSGTRFEAERDTFAYRFRKQILPVIRAALLTAALFSLIIFLGYRFVYRPVKAYTLYQRGYGHLQAEEFPQSGSYFDEATNTWAMKGQFHKYARAYREFGQWSRAAAIYERLLDRFGLDKSAVLDYAAMEYEDLADYPKALSILERFLSIEKNLNDYDALLLSSDIHLEWGKQQPERLEDARLNLARLMHFHGVKNEFLFRMLRYFIRTDNLQEVQALQYRFQSDPKLQVDAEAYAELGGYLLDNNILEEVRDILFRAKDADERLPEVHYQLARFFGRIDDHNEMRKALDNTILYLGALPQLNGERHFIFMDSYRRLGEYHFSREEYLEAEEANRKGIDLYESARQRGILPIRREAGILYANMADIPYYVGGDLDLAMEYLQKAQANDYTSDLVEYKMGFIRYRKGDYRQAQLNFASAADGFTTNSNLLYAMANTSFKRDNILIAEGYYRTVLARLENRRRSLGDFQPLEQSSHRAVVENLIRVHNNLAVTLYRLYQRTGRGSAYTEALRHLSAGNELFENFRRDPETMERSGLVNLAFLNQRGMIYPDGDYEPQIYPEVPQDLESLFFYR